MASAQPAVRDERFEFLEGLCGAERLRLSLRSRRDQVVGEGTFPALLTAALRVRRAADLL